MVKEKSWWTRIRNSFRHMSPMPRFGRKTFNRIKVRVLIGVLVGSLLLLITAGFSLVGNWIFEGIQSRAERQEQIGYLTSIIVKYRHWVYDIEDRPEAAGTDSTNRAHRTQLIEMMVGELSVALNRNAAQLSFEETRQLEFAIEHWYRFPSFLEPSEIDELFTYLESIEWLDLAPRPY